MGGRECAAGAPVRGDAAGGGIVIAWTASWGGVRDGLEGAVDGRDDVGGTERGRKEA